MYKLQYSHGFPHTKKLNLKKGISNIFSPCYPKGIHWFPQKRFNQFGSAIQPAISNIYIYICKYNQYSIYYSIKYKQIYILKTCYKFFLARTFYKHRKHHQSKNEIMPRQTLGTIRSWLYTQVDEESANGHKVLDSLFDDTIGQFIKSDTGLKHYTEFLSANDHGSDKHQWGQRI